MAGINLEKLVNMIMGAETEKDLDDLNNQLSNTGVAEALTRNRLQLEGLLAAFDPQRNTLGLLHLLHAVISGPKFDKLCWLTSAQGVIFRGSIKQIRLEPKKYGVICRKFVEVCQEVKKPMRAVKVLRAAISKFPDDHLTPAHTGFVLACILSKCYKTALPVLDKFVYLIDPKITGVKSEDTRLYYYYGGICYLAQKQWDNAIEFFETVISAPAVMASAIMVESYKKLVLCSLIHRGQVDSLPKFTNPSVTRVIKQYCQVYEELATAFSTHSIEDFNKAMENNLEGLVKDSNLGLVGQVKRALTTQLVKQLTSTYLTITMEGLLEQTGFSGRGEAEAEILKMIDSAGFVARINQQLGFVSFEHSLDEYDNDKTVNYLNTHICKTVSVHKQIASLDRSIEKSDKHVQKILQTEKFPGRDSDVDTRGLHAQ